MISESDIADEDPIICRQCHRNLPRCHVCGNAAGLKLYGEKEYDVCGKQCILTLTRQHENDYKRWTKFPGSNLKLKDQNCHNITHKLCYSTLRILYNKLYEI